LDAGGVVDQKILYTGLGCIIAAIVGGGIKAFGMEIPLVNSLKRQSLLGAFGCVLAALSFTAPHAAEQPGSDKNSGTATAAAKPLPNLAIGTWTLANAIDRNGKDWSDSTLKFLSQEETPGGLVLKGTLSQEHLAVGSYSAIVADDERSLG
jgi:hypothetical protein